MIYLAVRAFIQNDAGRILILLRSADDEYGDLWCLPGGKIDHGQTAEEAIKREIQEETSLECTSTQFLFYMDGLPEEPNGKHYLTLFFKCTTKRTISLNEESEAYAWLNPNEIKNFKFAFKNDEALVRFWKLL